MIFTNAYLITNDDDEEGIISLGTFLSRGDTLIIHMHNLTFSLFLKDRYGHFSHLDIVACRYFHFKVYNFTLW